MKRLLITVATALGVGSLGSVANAIEEPQYTVVQQLEGIEVRNYAPYLVAEVVVPGPADAAGNQGFRILAAYIFGKNKGERRMQMTAPVTQTPEPARIAMTAPVTQAPTEAGYVVQFKMPAEFTLEHPAGTAGSSGKTQGSPGWPVCRHPVLGHLVRGELF